MYFDGQGRDTGFCPCLFSIHPPKLIIMAVAYDEDVSTITYLNQELIQLNVNGYRLFLGYGIGEYDEMHMFDKNGNCLEQIKE